MREYKFRGKRIDNGEWVYGYVYKDALIGCNILQTKPCLAAIMVDPSTAGQYTGLKDKNGKEIYEGDVVRLFGGEYCQGYYEHDQTIVVKSAYDIVAMEESENVQLLGNVWDNPELLKEGSV
mgnify:CR=1 FL=1